MPLRILVAFDDSEPAREALSYAIELFPKGEFTAVTVVDASAVPYIPNTAADSVLDSTADVESGDGDREESQDLLSVGTTHLSDAERIAAEYGVDIETHSRVGSPAQEIVDYAGKGAFDHIVLGSHGRSGVSRLVLGSVAEVVVRHAPVPVTVVR